MHTFRAFIFDEKNRIVRAEVLNAKSDDEAVAKAMPFAEDSDIEVWRGNRLIARLLKGGFPAPAPENNE